MLYTVCSVNDAISLLLSRNTTDFKKKGFYTCILGE